MGRMIAIHLGAAESQVAVMVGRSPRVIPNLEGHRATPTIVGFNEAGGAYVGEAARLLSAFEDSPGGVLPVVSLLGRKLDARTARAARRWAGARLGAAANGDLRVIVGDDALSPPEIAAHLFGYLKAAAERRLGERVDEAVIAVPAAFDDLQRQATRDAGEIAGLRVVRLVNASTAAALSLGLESPGRRRRVALSHFECQSFDVSILEIDDGWVRVLATAGAFGDAGESFVESAAGLCRRSLEDARLAPQQIDEVLVAGEQARTGSSDLVQRMFGKGPGRVSPTDGVVLGAALQAGLLQGELSDLVLLDATPHTLGIETKDGTFTPVIERASTIPTRKRRLFTTIADGQTHVLVHVLQGESDLAAFNQSLHKFDLVEIPWARRGKPQIEVAFSVDVNGAMSVEATDRETQRRQAIRVHASGGLCRTEVERLARLWLTKPPTGSSSPDERLLSMSRTA